MSNFGNVRIEDKNGREVLITGQNEMLVSPVYRFQEGLTVVGNGADFITVYE